MGEVFDDPWPWVVAIIAICVTILIGMGISTAATVDPDMQTCVNAGGTYLDLRGNDLCLIGITLMEQ